MVVEGGIMMGLEMVMVNILVVMGKEMIIEGETGRSLPRFAFALCSLAETDEKGALGNVKKDRL